MFIDSHCHFNFDCFKNERQALIEQMKQQEINKLIIPGTDAKGWADIIYLAEQNHHFYYALGIHPHFLSDFSDEHLVQLKTLLINGLSQSHKQCVAVGEIGLDKLIETDLATQERIFLAQLAIAASLKLPVILHVVKMQSRILQLLKQSKFSYGGVYHAFSGSEEIAHEFIKLGFKLGIGGVITYPSAIKTRRTLTDLPLTSLVLETDAPDMPIHQQVESYNSPLNLKIVFNALCELRKESQQVVSDQIYQNTKSIFSIIDD